MEVHLPALPIDWRYEVKKYRKAVKAILDSGEEGIEKNRFIENFGRETYGELTKNWLIEERENRCVATEVSRAILEALLQLPRG